MRWLFWSPVLRVKQTGTTDIFNTQSLAVLSAGVARSVQWLAKDCVSCVSIPCRSKNFFFSLYPHGLNVHAATCTGNGWGGGRGGRLVVSAALSEAWSWQLVFTYCRVKELREPYLHTFVCCFSNPWKWELHVTSKLKLTCFPHVEFDTYPTLCTIFLPLPQKSLYVHSACKML